MPKQYAVIRTNKSRAAAIFAHLEQGTLRQGWGYHPRQDLHKVQQKRATNQPLDDDERAAWGNRRLLASEWNGLQLGDLIICPNLPEHGLWVLARVAGPYHYDTSELTNDDRYHRHCLPVAPLRTSSGEVARIHPHHPLVDARLRQTMRNIRRMWGIDHLAEAVEQLVRAVEAGEDLSPPESKAERARSFRSKLHPKLNASVWAALQEDYQGAELEHLLHELLGEIYGRGHVSHVAGPNERGADLLVTIPARSGWSFAWPSRSRCTRAPSPTSTSSSSCAVLIRPTRPTPWCC